MEGAGDQNTGTQAQLLYIREVIKCKDWEENGKKELKQVWKKLKMYIDEK